ncbi:MAG: tyrosine-protein phosphatase [Clostridia bacterium]|nr:tyrosine-protein phosphatase [Clostridia bacterium]
MKLRRFLAILMICLVALPLCPSLAEQAEIPAFETDIADIQKYGNLVLNITGSSVLELGYGYGDVVSVTILGETLDMPVGSSYSDVDTGSMIFRVVTDESGDAVILAINMGDLATTLGLAAKSKIDEDPGFRWDYAEGVETPVAVTVAMKEKGGYADEYLIHQLVRTNERADYASLTDEQYANFRAVTTTGMGEGALYRSSSPVNPEINRNKEADEALNGAGVETVMNLADNEETMKGYEDYATSYYAQRQVIPLNLGVDFSAADFQSGLADGMRFFASHEGPYLVHCNEGKDRAGFVSAILECLMGASADEIVADYMVTYFNYYGVEEDSEQYEAIVRSNIAKTLAAAFGVESIWDADLAAKAQDYLAAIGVSDGDIAALKANLGKSYVE